MYPCVLHRETKAWGFLNNLSKIQEVISDMNSVNEHLSDSKASGLFPHSLFCSTLTRGKFEDRENVLRYYGSDLFKSVVTSFSFQHNPGEVAMCQALEDLSLIFPWS